MHVARGERVALGPLGREHAALYAQWVNDPEVKDGILNLGLYTAADEERFIEAAQEETARRNPTGVRFTIFDLSDDAPVGICGLDGIDWRHRRCEFGIALGERRGQGLGTEATRLTLQWAFDVLSLNNVLLSSHAHNAQAQRAYEKAGFKLVGVRREALLARGRLRDEVLMDALAADFPLAGGSG
jgi:RimJ/RimL family protein N-acetyltransferase